MSEQEIDIVQHKRHIDCMATGIATSDIDGKLFTFNYGWVLHLENKFINMGEPKIISWQGKCRHLVTLEAQMYILKFADLARTHSKIPMNFIVKTKPYFGYFGNVYICSYKICDNIAEFNFEGTDALMEIKGE